MATFSPPVSSAGVPPVNADPEIGDRLFRYYSARPGGDGNNVYYRVTSGRGTPSEVGEVTNIDPYTTYNADGTVDVEAWSDVDHVWYAGHAAETVTTPQATALVAGGYTVVG